MTEDYKDIETYKGKYQISNLGNVKSLERYVVNKGNNALVKGKILTPTIDAHGYKVVNLYKDGKRKLHKIHQLVAEYFLNHIPDGFEKVVDHIDNNRLNNNLENLQITSNRHNVSKDRIGTSKYTGVSWSKSRLKWCASIYLNGKSFNLGRYDSEIGASTAYQNALDNHKTTK